MSTSLLYHAFGVRGYSYVKTEYVGGEAIQELLPQVRPLLTGPAATTTFRG